MSNRISAIIETLDREAEHARRIDRVNRSLEMYAAAQAEALEHGITLTEQLAVYRLWDERHHVAFYPIHSLVMRSIVGKHRLERIDVPQSSDVYDVTLMFLAGEFLK